MERIDRPAQRIKDATRRRTVTAHMGADGLEDLDESVALLQRASLSGRRVTRSEALREAVRVLRTQLENKLSNDEWNARQEEREAKRK